MDEIGYPLLKTKYIRLSGREFSAPNGAGAGQGRGCLRGERNLSIFDS